MKKTIFHLALIFAISLTGTQAAQGQETSEEDRSYRPLTLQLDDSGNKYIRFIMWHQVWATTNNLAVEESKLTVTPSIRRSRFLAYAQISPRFLILTHFGLNGLNPNNLSALGNDRNSPQFFLHGAWTEFKVTNELYIGGGLHYWKGMTRLANQSTLNFMTLDQSRPFVHWHSLGISDQFARHLGIYAKGKIGRFDYRVALNSPGRNPLGGGIDFGGQSEWTYTGATTPNSEDATTGNTVVEGYFRYNFWDQESTKLPYQVGTYLGEKKVLGIGAGFFAHPNGMYNAEEAIHGDVMHFAVDAFFDVPTNSGGVNAYASLLHFNYGENYLSRWAGTGTAFYGHVGHYFSGPKLMPYVAYQIGAYDALDTNPTALDIGMNYFLNGHHAKLTLEYHRISDNPLEGGIDQDVTQLRLQAHIFL